MAHWLLTAGDFVDTHRDTFGSSRSARSRRSLRRDIASTLLFGESRSGAARAKRDELLVPQIERVWSGNMQVYGADKVWRQLQRERLEIARCTVERLMRQMGIQEIGRASCRERVCQYV